LTKRTQEHFHPACSSSGVVAVAEAVVAAADAGRFVVRPEMAANWEAINHCLKEAEECHASHL
jgi:hypothetical protein